MSGPTTAAVIVAAGAGLRVGGELPKQYQMLAGQSVLARSIKAFADHPGIAHVQVVIGADHSQLYDAATNGLDLPAAVIGGETRQASVKAGLEALASLAPDYVLIHDAARPFVSPDIISHVIANLDRHDGALPALPLVDTIKRANGSVITETVDRKALYAAQTPQGFHYGKICGAHDAASNDSDAEFTDDASIAEWAGLSVVLVAGAAQNRKLTTADDMTQAEQMLTNTLPDIRVGHGYDVHAFEAGDHVILCGVKIPHDAKLKGHSDADVAMHTLTDAILGAISEGDIGAHFPPSDDQWKAADSAIFLREAARLVAERGGLIAHCDLTIICEAPKLRPHVDAMRQSLADILGLPAGRVSVKATTSEKLGFTGRREGIAATATATVRLPIE
ncbi:MAG: bifunctional 2-C-methyl-D-erythritol 4-phosphate cytidylyltransferase/2-C-methyl-D-erythritol 2,4-cyclodiphosphate synthase [Rhizobiales bacterium]|nr:bifunctional 2-C-methyl-D-erythritol 4-phosphate cytidylyltransferase/2-C-methyl-D-erythritol 2,4-cyclodiphosphate synthase [Hyphomicrobiales bacterium]